MNVNKYIVDFDKLVTQRIPELLRTPEVIAFVKLIASPFVFLYNQFISFRVSTLYRLKITPQVVYLQKLLNDRFDNDERRIYIEDSEIFSKLFLYTKTEDRLKFLYRKSETTKVYLYTKAETELVTFDFVVFIPSDVLYDLAEITALLTTYKLPTKTFTIKTF